MSETTEITTTDPVATAAAPAPNASVAVATEGGNIELTAQTPMEMVECQSAMIHWMERKIDIVSKEAAELKGAFEHALAKKWKSGVLKRHSELAAKRVEYYKKIRTALKAGYYIIPNFPCTIFAIRTDKTKPAKMLRQGSRYTPNLTQEASTLPEGEGDYKNPVPQLACGNSYKDQYQADVRNYWATDWDDMEFPSNMAKLQIMEATTEAMKLKVFDALGMLPADRRRHPDPILLGRILEPRKSGSLSEHRYVNFMIAWHFDTSTL